MLQMEALLKFIEKGVNVNKPNSQGETPLHVASFSGSTDVAAVLLDHGGDPNIVTCAGETCLHYAVRSQNPNMVQLLLGRKAEMCSSPVYGTPLDLAVRSNQYKMIALMAPQQPLQAHRQKVLLASITPS